MPIGVVFEAPGMTREQYDAITDRLTDGAGLRSPSDWPIEGLQSHVAGPTADGWRVVDVWESEEAFQRFGERLMPIIQEVGIDVEPEVFPVHNFVK